jgi:hypothetical protein
MQTTCCRHTYIADVTATKALTKSSFWTTFLMLWPTAGYWWMPLLVQNFIRATSASVCEWQPLAGGEPHIMAPGSLTAKPR